MFFYFQNFLIVYLLSHIILNPAHAQDTNLWYAAELGDSTRVAHLLDQGADIDEPDNKGRTALIYAASRGHLSIVTMLLNHGANIHAEGQYQLSPLNAAIKRNHIDIVKLLLDAGADVHLSDLKGVKPLQIAVELGHIDIVKLLLEKGANPNTLSDKSVPIVLLAYNTDHNAIAETLIQHGATLTPKSPYAHSDINFLSTDTLAIKQSLAEGVAPPMALRLVVELGDTTALHQLLKNNAVHINTPTKGLVTPLMVAVGKGNMSIVQTLIEAGADPFTQDEKRRTAITYTRFIKDRQKRKQMQHYLYHVINSRQIHK